MRLLVLGRNSPVKNHDFVEIMERLHESGVSAVLSMTGANKNEIMANTELDIRCLGWVEESREAELISESIFFSLQANTRALPCR